MSIEDTVSGDTCTPIIGKSSTANYYLCHYSDERHTKSLFLLRLETRLCLMNWL